MCTVCIIRCLDITVYPFFCSNIPSTTLRFYCPYFWISQTWSNTDLPLCYDLYGQLRDTKWIILHLWELVKASRARPVLQQFSSAAGEELTVMWCNDSNNAPEIDTIFPLSNRDHFATNPLLRTAIASRCGWHTLCTGPKHIQVRTLA